ncbi:MAG: hypothetical protein ACYDER_21650 [Ktedonobacteraceae bacterium]
MVKFLQAITSSIAAMNTMHIVLYLTVYVHCSGALPGVVFAKSGNMFRLRDIIASPL